MSPGDVRGIFKSLQADFRKFAHTVHKLEKHPQEVKPNLNLSLPFNFNYELNKFQLTSQISPPTPWLQPEVKIINVHHFFFLNGFCECTCIQTVRRHPPLWGSTCERLQPPAWRRRCSRASERSWWARCTEGRTAAWWLLPGHTARTKWQSVTQTDGCNDGCVDQ